MPFTFEQEDFISTSVSSKNSILCQALPGTGKTFCLAEIGARMREHSCLATSFSQKTVAELRQALPAWIDVKSFNSLGNSAWNSAIGKRCEVNKDKLRDLLRKYSLGEEEYQVVRTLVTRARHVGLVPSNSQGIALVKDTPENWFDLTDLNPSENLIKTAREILLQSIQLGYQGLIDFDDQIYLSSLFGGIFKKYKTVLIDEAQDLSLLNIRQMRRIVEGRIIAVGDKNQSIYAFRGSEVNAIDKLLELREAWEDKLLSITFRCSKAVVENIKHVLLEFKAAPNAPEGSFKRFISEWRWSQIPKTQTCAILCRNNAPLVKMSFALISAKIPFQFLKGNSISLLRLAKKLLPARAISEEYLEILNSFIAAESAAEKPNQSNIDGAEALLGIVSACEATSLPQILEALQTAFPKEERGLVLATGHGAKGLEWDTVIHLDPWRIPSIFARSDAEKVQERNILTVIETRAKLHLVVVNVDMFRGA